MFTTTPWLSAYPISPGRCSSDNRCRDGPSGCSSSFAPARFPSSARIRSHSVRMMSSVDEERMARLYYGTLISRTLPFLKSRPSVPTLSLRK
jgi:hypothetical protein